MSELFSSDGPPDEAWEIVPEVFNLETSCPPRRRGETMSSGPDPVEPSAAELLGARRLSGVAGLLRRGHLLARAVGNGAKRLVAVAEEESAFGAFAGATETVDGRVRLAADTTADNALALRSALPWLTPSRFGLPHLGRFR